MNFNIYFITILEYFVTIFLLPSTANKLSHVKFKDEIEKSSKKESGYLCKKYYGYPYCGCVINGKLPLVFNYPNLDTDNAEEFFKITTMPVCGNQYFNQLKRCALANFFEDKKPETVPKENEYKKMLILLDGCATCIKGGKITGLRMTHFEESGGFFCSEVKEYEAFRVSGLSITIPANQNSDGNSGAFTVPAVLSHRSCGIIFSTIEPSDKYVDLKLYIDYSCGGIASTKIINLPSIDVTAHKDRVAELRGISINLDNGKATQYIRNGITYKLNDKISNVWINPQLDCWTKSGVCKLP